MKNLSIKNHVCYLSNRDFSVTYKYNIEFHNFNSVTFPNSLNDPDLQLIYKPLTLFALNFNVYKISNYS